jgi:hypothetical protein
MKIRFLTSPFLKPLKIILVDEKGQFSYSAMSQDWLNSLVTYSIEKDILKNIDLDIVNNDFASKKCPTELFVMRGIDYS